jgi:hypothetical protein
MIAHCGIRFELSAPDRFMAIYLVLVLQPAISGMQGETAWSSLTSCEALIDRTF